MNTSKYPLTLQHSEKIAKSKISGKTDHIKVEALQSSKVSSQNFYRPISKMIKLDEFK